MPQITEAKKYGFEFLQKINQDYSLYGNANRRVIAHHKGEGEIISYVICGTEIELFSWNLFKKDSPVHSIDDMVRC